MAIAKVWDAYRRHEYEGFVFKRYSNGVTIDLSNGTRYFATNDRIISIDGETESLTVVKEDSENG